MHPILGNTFRKHIRDQDTQARLEIRIHSQKPDRSALFVKTADEELLIENIYTEESKEGLGGGSELITAEKEPGRGKYKRMDKYFLRLWNKATPISLYDLEKGMVKLELANIVVMSEFPLLAYDAKKDKKKIYDKAFTLHKQRRLDEASELYRRILKVEPMLAPNAQQLELARHFLPRVFATPNEPFKLKDLVVVVHPDKPLIAYHLVWQDDIDFLIDNDAGDHEIVWIQYDKAQKRVEKVWAYWHEKVYQTKEAVEDANRHNSRVAIYVQWGKHGSLLKGWREIIKIDGDKNVEEFEPLQYSRLSSDKGTRLARGNKKAIGFYAEQFASKFNGTEEEFTTFKEQDKFDLQELLRNKEMIVVSKYANAVIDQWFLPYNIHPKPDWPCD